MREPLSKVTMDVSNSVASALSLAKEIGREMPTSPLCLPRANRAVIAATPLANRMAEMEHRMAKGEQFFEARNFLDCNSLENPDHHFTLQRGPGDHGHQLFDSCPKCADAKRERVPD
jgi:hypothetical protein